VQCLLCTKVGVFAAVLISIDQAGDTKHGTASGTAMFGFISRDKNHEPQDTLQGDNVL